MASTPEVVTSDTLTQLRQLTHSGGLHLSLPVLVPNERGLSALLSLLSAHSLVEAPPLTDEIAVFVSATDGFSRANLNTSVEDSLEALPPLIGRARAAGLKVRAYVSAVLGCPFEGRVDPSRPASVARKLLEMGAYEVSLGDTIGVGVPKGWEALLNECERKGVPVSKLAAHCHDTYGTAIANVLHCVSVCRVPWLPSAPHLTHLPSIVSQLGVSTVDSSIASLGGCPFSPGSTGNVSTEDVLYALSTSGIPTTVLPDPDHLPSSSWSWEDLLDGQGERARKFEEICAVGQWVSDALGRENGSRVGRAMKGRRERRHREWAKL
ncbi:SPOSA6832_03121 [Sporobolomyces salmonicolor]|uniref:hydroxymethylglutaryl-CoA lyase n=1 Tax=Sporidiobolus salmonicolor TaxID=5005 RepID=A0A0D6EMZ9_SPOSA|nr:SPOSA6832_03121 [Sporobolomyces salmonicolor]